ncbi:hypothetical protein ACIOEX_01520 [Streptomyces sp. NPDC087850]|uniref:hypothetical protein n=1 Tax=Streptomyces sp. NPDC087850 TaxID=3365809 RepID=UPI00381E27D6
MKRSLRRHIKRAINQTRPTHGNVTTVIVFPADAFADAPEWNPGPGFKATIDEYALRRDNQDGTVTAIVSAAGPKELPAHHGGQWTEPEVWTVTAPASNCIMRSYVFEDKPNSITWLADDPDAVIHREPYHGHPAAAVHAYWEAFETGSGFWPQLLVDGRQPYGAGRRWVALTFEPRWAGRPGEPTVGDLLEAVVSICRRYGAKVRVYPWRPGARNGPVREDHLALHMLLRSRARLAATCSDYAQIAGDDLRRTRPDLPVQGV